MFGERLLSVSRGACYGKADRRRRLVKNTESGKDYMMSETNIRKELASLERMSAGQLRDKYRELFGDESRSGNRQWLYRRCAWRIQAIAQGGLSERARKLAMAIADDGDVRFIPPSQAVPDADTLRQTRPTDIKPDSRLPIAHTVLTRPYKGRLYTITVLPNGFEYDGEIYRSLTGVAHAITGCHWNGYHFFRKALTNTKRTGEAE